MQTGKIMGVVLALAMGGIASADAVAQQRIKAEYWYGLTGQLGEVMADHCKRFNASQTRYEMVLSLIHI